MNSTPAQPDNPSHNEGHKPQRNVVEMMGDVEKCRAWRLHKQLKQIDLAHKILFGNAKELLILLDKHEDPQHMMQLMTMGNESAMQHELAEANRLLHNFVAAAKSLVEMDRNIIRAAVSDIIVRQYEAEAKTRFANDSLIQFVQQLRNYCLHVANPLVGATLTGDGQGFKASSVHLVKQSVMSWTEWNTSARGFLSSCLPEIRLQPIVKSYCDKVEQFREWIYNLVHTAYKADFEHLDKLRAVGKAVVLDDMKASGAEIPPTWLE